ncbi:MAG: 4Fe-4S dicluster domain-containing protein [Chloroflexi bacterium]|nr:4Fe-4S dicluster domain-containing protein [Chloroflexota bacterium]
MFCQKCGKELSKGATVCASCGFQPVESKIRVKNIWRVTPTMGVVSENKFATDCTACETCMNFCSHFHEGSANTVLSRIVINPTELEWMLHETDDPTVERTICRQCPGLAPCMAVCKVAGAMYRDEKTGAVIIDPEYCNNCRACERACPYNAVWYVEGADKMLKCDLCGGEPQCVEVCPVFCLKYEKVA